MKNREIEHDEDLKELLGEESLEENEIEEKVNDEEYEEVNTEISLDNEIEKNISSFIKWAGAAKWIMIILGVIMFIISLANTGGALTGIIMLFIFVIYGFLFSLFLKWFGYVLKCLQDIKNK